MLPDFKKAKDRAHRDLLRWVRRSIPAVTPLIQGVATVRQHEGRSGSIVRPDETRDTIDYQPQSFELALSRDEMKRSDLRILQEKLKTLSEQIGQAQTKRMLQVAGEAADSVGNVVHADGNLTQDHFLEMLRRVQMDFDPETLQPAPGFFWVMHPDTAASIIPKVKEWEKDPEFNARYERVMEEKREEWRDREADRKLVD